MAQLTHFHALTGLHKEQHRQDSTTQFTQVERKHPLDLMPIRG